MENKKLLKFLFKDIAEIEELFQEKGAEGFDEYEIEFIGSRFKGAKQILQILSEKENRQLEKIRPRPALPSDESEQLQSPLVNDEVENTQIQPEDDEKESEQAPITAEVEESLNSLSEFEEELKQDDEMPKELEEEEPISDEPKIAAEESQPQPELIAEDVVEEPAPSIQHQESSVELEDEPNVDVANHRLGDSFAKEKSVNELLAVDANKLEYKISNSPVASIKTAIGINDRYQYIRELFEGNAEAFSKAVDELDDLNSISEAVSYLQQNYKWKKNDTSLKFVSLIKRRFPNA